MLVHYLLALMAEVPEVPEPVTRGLWSFARDFLLLLIAAATCWWTVGRPWWNHREKKRDAERTAREQQRAAVVAEQAAKVMAPIQDDVKELREQVGAIHHTTTVNGGVSPQPTLRDQVETVIKALGAIAVNQAGLSSRFDDHERNGERYLEVARAALEDQGIHLPDAAELSADDDSEEIP